MELLLSILVLCFVVLVLNPINNHPLSVGSVRMTEWDRRIDQIRGFLSNGFLGCFLLLVNNPSGSQTLCPTNREIIFLNCLWALLLAGCFVFPSAMRFSIDNR